MSYDIHRFTDEERIAIYDMTEDEPEDTNVLTDEDLFAIVYG